LSNHCPLLLSDDRGPRKPQTFKFENFWTRMPGFWTLLRRLGIILPLIWSRVKTSSTS
jgi:hypothetical protein